MIAKASIDDSKIQGATTVNTRKKPEHSKTAELSYKNDRILSSNREYKLKRAAMLV